MTNDWLGAIRPTDALSIYVHVPFCGRLLWSCGCHTSAPNGYDRIADLLGHPASELDLWSEAMPPHAGAAHVHFGSGSPDSLSRDDYSSLLASSSRRFALRPGAELAVELDPGHLDQDFARGLDAAAPHAPASASPTLGDSVNSFVHMRSEIWLTCNAWLSPPPSIRSPPPGKRGGVASPPGGTGNPVGSRHPLIIHHRALTAKPLHLLGFLFVMRLMR